MNPGSCGKQVLRTFDTGNDRSEGMMFRMLFRSFRLLRPLRLPREAVSKEGEPPTPRMGTIHRPPRNVPCRPADIQGITSSESRSTAQQSPGFL